MGQMIHAEAIAPVFDGHVEVAEKAKSLLNRVVRFWGPMEKAYGLPQQPAGSPSYSRYMDQVRPHVSVV